MSVPKWKQPEGSNDLFMSTRKFVDHIIHICNNPNIKGSEYNIVAQKLMDISMEIHEYVWCANNTKLGNPKRLEYQNMALDAIKRFKVKWDLSEKLFHFRKKKTKYVWDLLSNMEPMIKNWIKSDANRIEENNSEA